MVHKSIHLDGRDLQRRLELIVQRPNGVSARIPDARKLGLHPKEVVVQRLGGGGIGASAI
eukprot:7773380-Pyramimonas_sp.AAC.1